MSKKRSNGSNKPSKKVENTVKETTEEVAVVEAQEEEVEKEGGVLEANNVNPLGNKIVNPDFVPSQARSAQPRANKAPAEALPPAADGYLKGAYMPYLADLIQKGKHTQKELVEMCVSEFPHLRKATFQTVLTDSRNPRYCKFPHLVLRDEKGILTFSKEEFKHGK